MARFFKKREQSKGLAPGHLVFIGEQKVEEIQVHLFDYDSEKVVDTDLDELIPAKEIIDAPSITWLNVNGIHDTDAIRAIGEAFELHPLLLEDVLNTGQRPKLETYGNCVFIVMKMLRFDKANDVIIAEQLSMVIGSTFVLTFQEQPGDVFEPVRTRIRKSLGRVRVSGVDYLAFALLDNVVDNYVDIVERLGGDIEDLELEVLDEPTAQILQKITGLKREMTFIRKSVRPAKEAMALLSKLDSDVIQESTVPFLKELVDNANQASEAIEVYREMLSDALATYNTVVSNRMNEIMKVLTIFSAVFIPLTFIAGIYGTNFEYLPELKYRYSYFIFWGVMLSVGAGMLLYFRRRRWL